MEATEEQIAQCSNRFRELVVAHGYKTGYRRLQREYANDRDTLTAFECSNQAAAPIGSKHGTHTSDEQTTKAVRRHLGLYDNCR